MALGSCELSSLEGKGLLLSFVLERSVPAGTWKMWQSQPWTGQGPKRCFVTVIYCSLLLKVRLSSHRKLHVLLFCRTSQSLPAPAERKAASAHICKALPPTLLEAVRPRAISPSPCFICTNFQLRTSQNFAAPRDATPCPSLCCHLSLPPFEASKT